PGYFNKVIAVTKNFNHGSLREEVGPVFINYSPFIKRNPLKLLVRVERIDDNALFSLKSTWRTMFPDHPFEFVHLKEEYGKIHAREFSLIQLMIFSSVCCFAITLFGVSGLSYYYAQRRLKEMAIRKIHGATANQIVMIFIRKVANWVVIGGCIGIPLGLLIVNQWLQTFAFRTNVGMLTVLLPFVATFLLII